MNNRQKAKHFKKLYERLLNMPIPPVTITPKRVVIIKATKTVHESVITNTLSADERPPYVIAGDLLYEELTKKVMEFSKCKVVPSEIPDHVDLVATVEVLESVGK